MRPGLRVPEGYTTAHVSGGMLVARAESLAAARAMVVSAGSLHAFAAAHGTALAGRGRGVAHRVTGADSDWVVRHYRRGGSMARPLGDRYLRIGTPRPLTELRASQAARAKGIATPAVEALFVRSVGVFYRADLATRYVPDSRDLASSVFEHHGSGDDEALHAAWRAAGALLGAAFAAGVVHLDLNLGNVLLQTDGAGIRAHLIDLDRARVVDRLTEVQRGRMLERFHRSRRKLERAAGRQVSAGELAAFEAGLRG
jgi:tRNA A-37 threonylcarbamoyl transferase component Bud32